MFKRIKNWVTSLASLGDERKRIEEYHAIYDDDSGISNPVRELICNEMSGDQDQEKAKTDDEYVKSVILDNIQFINTSVYLHNFVDKHANATLSRETLISVLVIQKRTALLEWLLEKIPRVDPNLPHERPPLEYALLHQHFTEAKILLNHPKIRMFDVSSKRRWLVNKQILFSLAIYPHRSDEEIKRRMTGAIKQHERSPEFHDHCYNSLHLSLKKCIKNPFEMKLYIRSDVLENTNWELPPMEEESAQVLALLLLLNDQILKVKNKFP